MTMDILRVLVCKYSIVTLKMTTENFIDQQRNMNIGTLSMSPKHLISYTKQITLCGQLLDS